MRGEEGTVVKWLFFGIGILLGTMLDVTIMCVLQINRLHRFDEMDMQ